MKDLGNQYDDPGGASPGNLIPPPSELHATSYTAMDLYRLGREYRQDLAVLNVAPMDGYDWARFSPGWTGTSPDPAGLAYCMYSFGLDGYDQETALYLDFYESRAWDDVWIGLANFDRDRWDWFQTAEDMPLNFVIDDPGRLHPDSSELFVVVLCTGTELWTLNDLRVGPVIAPTINEVGPLQLGIGQPVPLSADVDGSVPLYYSWDFGTAHAASTEESPLVTIFNPGEYECQLSVLNPAGTDVFDFTLTVAEVDQWVHSWGGSDVDKVYDIAVDATGNIYASGHTASFGSCGILLKYSQAGELLWARRFDGGDGDGFYAIEVGAGQDIFAVGSTSSYGAGMSDILVARFTPDGELVWAYAWGGESAEVGTDLALDADGDLVVMGTTTSYSADEGGFNSLVLLYISAAGDLTVGSLYSVDRNLYVAEGGVTVDAAGNAYVAVSGNAFPGYLLKFNSGGGLTGQVTYNGIDYTMLSGIDMDSAGNLYVVGSSSGMFTDNQIVLMRYNSSLERLWSRQWGPIVDHDNGYDLVVDENDNIWFAGESVTMASNDFSLVIGYVGSDGTTYATQAWSMTNDDHSGNSDREAGLCIDWHPAGKPVIAGYCGYSGGEWEALAEAGSTLSTEQDGVGTGAWVNLNLASQGEYTAITGADVSEITTATEDTGGGDNDALVIFGSPL